MYSELWTRSLQGLECISASKSWELYRPIRSRYVECLTNQRSGWRGEKDPSKWNNLILSWSQLTAGGVESRICSRGLISGPRKKSLSLELALQCIIYFNEKRVAKCDAFRWVLWLMNNEFIALRVHFLHCRTGPHINICRQAPYVNLQLPNIQGIKNNENPGVNWLTLETSQWNALTLHFTRFLPDLFPMRGLAKIFQHNVGRETKETFVAVIPNPLSYAAKIWMYENEFLNSNTFSA